MPPADDLELGHHLADLADAVTGAAFTGSPLEHRIKADGSPVTATDHEVETRIRAALAVARPADAVLGEEIGINGTGHRTWIVDGVDGTVNFITGRPGWATEIALVEDGRVVLGISTSPALGRRWWGAPGHGAWVADLATGRPREAGRALRVTARPDTGFATMPDRARFAGHPEEALLQALEDLGPYVASTVHGAVTVAQGEAIACLHARGGPWDFAAFAAIVIGAGGCCTDLDGVTRFDHGGPVVYSAGPDHDRLLAALRRGSEQQHRDRQDGHRADEGAHGRGAGP